VIIAILAAQAGFQAADGIGGIVIGLFIIYIGVEITIKTSFQLMGTRPAPDLYKEIEAVVMKIDQVHAIHDIVSHEYGAQKVITFHLEVPNYLALSEAHNIAEEVEARIENDLHIQATVHLDPVLPVINDQAALKELLKSFIEQQEQMLRFSDIRMIGDEAGASLIVNIGAKKAFSEDESETYRQNLQSIITARFPEIQKVYISFTTDLQKDSDKHLS
jgi:divalent metal cation (Fe/Co/Zn/Cd) transporter